MISWEIIHHLSYSPSLHSESELSSEDLKAKVEKHKKRWSGAGWVKQTIYIFGSAVFAVSVGIISLFTNDYITGQRVIDPVDIVVFIGIGMGIGSIKEFIDR